jgi:Flp pilus assembly protein TadG
MGGSRAKTVLSFLRDPKGATAVEFALILPLLLLLYMGGVQITIALTLSRKIHHTSAAIGDLVAQERYIDASELDDMLAVSASFLHPYDAGPYVIKVTGVRINASGQPSISWTRSLGNASVQPMSLGDLPDDVLKERDAFVVLTETFYHFSPVAGFGTSEPFELSGLSFHRPRVGGVVDCPDC